MNNYRKLDKHQKIEVMRKYANTKRGHRLAPVLDRLVIWGILALICGVIIAVWVLFMDLSKWALAFALVMLAFGILFLAVSNHIRHAEYNHYLEAEKETHQIYRKK